MNREKVFRVESDVTHGARDERGASAVEYGLLIAGVAALIVLVVFALGDVVSGQFADTCGSVANQIGTQSC
jgi:pilus assembly protein Flp/PilA